MEITFDFNEKKHVILDIYSIKNEPFEIQSASWKLIRKIGKEEEASGECEIRGHEIDMLIEPREAKNYILQVEYYILDERLVENVDVWVRKC